MAIDAVGEAGVRLPQQREPGVLDGLFGKLSAGFGIEELLIEDTRCQKTCARTLRRAQRDRQVRLLARAAEKMREAASNRLLSAVGASLVKVAVAVDGMLCAGPTQAATGKLQIAQKVILAAEQAGSEVLARFNPLEIEASEQDARAKQFEQEASRARGRQADARDWLVEARELERRMLSHLEKLDDTEHRGMSGVLGRME